MMPRHTLCTKMEGLVCEDKTGDKALAFVVYILSLVPSLETRLIYACSQPITNEADPTGYLQLMVYLS